MKSLWALIFLLATAACSINKQVTKDLLELEEDFHHHSGFMLYDLAEDKILVDHRANKYFTPASNTKIITLYASLSILGDSIPGLYYEQKGDSLIFWGTGDPSFLYDELPQSKTFDFLKNSENDLYFSYGNYYDRHLGPGWAWDDYTSIYSSEKSPLPIYANAFKVRKKSEQPYLRVDPTYFQRYFYLGDSLNKSRSRMTRDVNSNEIIYRPAAKMDGFSRDLPFRSDELTTAKLLADTLKKPVYLLSKPLPAEYKTLYSIPADSAYQVMMQDSNNFIAEQLLLLCSGQLSDSLQSEITINWSKENLLADSPDSIKWEDGSGLSRYNLITPRSVVWLWKQLYNKIDKDRLFSLLAAGGESGTIKYYYKADPPYIYGKTGTLRSNHVLSGFLITKKGKLMIFSFMNNNYPTESRPVKKRMEQLLWKIHENN